MGSLSYPMAINIHLDLKCRQLSIGKWIIFLEIIWFFFLSFFANDATHARTSHTHTHSHLFKHAGRVFGYRRWHKYHSSRFGVRHGYTTSSSRHLRWIRTSGWLNCFRAQVSSGRAGICHRPDAPTNVWALKIINKHKSWHSQICGRWWGTNGAWVDAWLLAQHHSEDFRSWHRSGWTIVSGIVGVHAQQESGNWFIVRIILPPFLRSSTD